MKLSASNQIFLAIVVGVAVGALAPGAVPYLSWMGDVFVLALKMLIAPLILGSIVMGMAALGDVSKLGSLGGRTLAYYVSTTVLAVALGLLVVQVVKPGRSDELGAQDVSAIRTFAAGGDASGRGLAAALRSEGWDAGSAGGVADAYDARLEGAAPEAPAAVEALARTVVSAERFRQRVAKTRGGAADQDAAKVRSAKARDMSVGDFLKAQLRKILQNPFKSLADMNVLGIIVFSLLLGGVLTTLGERGAPLVGVFDGLNVAMMKLVDLVMWLAPMGVLALMADQIASSGLGILRVLAWYMFAVLLGLGVHGLVTLPLLLKFVGRPPPCRSRWNAWTRTSA